MAGYGSEAASLAYFAAKGNTTWAASTTPKRDAARQRGSVYIDGRYLLKFPGTKTGGRGQERAWPRSGAEDWEGAAIDPSAVPIEVEQASYEAALIEDASPGSLTPTLSASDNIKYEKIGPIEEERFEPGSLADLRPTVTLIDEILAPVIARIVVPVLVV